MQDTTGVRKGEELDQEKLELFVRNNLKGVPEGHLEVKQFPAGGVSNLTYELRIGDFSEVVGLFDWEMTTVGDPLADLGAAMSYWLVAEDPDLLKYANGKPPITVLLGFMTREEFVEAYARKSGRDVSQFN